MGTAMHKLFLHVRVTKSTLSALCIVSPLSTLTVIYLTPNLAIVYPYMKKEPNACPSLHIALIWPLSKLPSTYIHNRADLNHALYRKYWLSAGKDLWFTPRQLHRELLHCINWETVADLEIQKGGFSHWRTKCTRKILGCRVHFQSRFKTV